MNPDPFYYTQYLGDDPPWPSQGPRTFDRAAYLKWVEDTFPGETTVERARHLCEEAQELVEALQSLDPTKIRKEVADVFLLMTCVANDLQLNLEHVAAEKFEIVKKRSWEKTDRGYRHVKEDVRMVPLPEDPCNWPEDFSHENGNYMHHCVDCGKTFLGYKRRVQCKVCAQKPSDTPKTKTVVAQLSQVLHEYQALLGRKVRFFTELKEVLKHL